MSYRVYIGSIDKHEYRHIKGMTLDELLKYKSQSSDKFKQVEYLSNFELVKQLYCFGQLNFDTSPYHLNFFLNPETTKYFTDEHDFWVVDRSFLLRVIEHYSELVRTNYKSSLKPFYDGKEPELLDSVEQSGYDDNLRSIHTMDLNKSTPRQTTAIHKLITNTLKMSREWGITFNNHGDGFRPYNVNEDSNMVVSSWKYEYAVFELVAILKMFDWEKNIMVYYGY